MRRIKFGTPGLQEHREVEYDKGNGAQRLLKRPGGLLKIGQNGQCHWLRKCVVKEPEKPVPVIEGSGSVAGGLHRVQLRSAGALWGH